MVNRFYINLNKLILKTVVNGNYKGLEIGIPFESANNFIFCFTLELKYL